MMRFFHFTSLILGTFLVAACSSSSDTSPGGTDSGTHPQDSGSPVTDSGSNTDTGSTTTDSGTSGDTGETGGGFTLKVENYLSWCNVGVNGGAANSNAVQTITVAPGTTVNLSGDALNATFVWGYWVGTAGDTSATHDTSKSTTVVVDKDNKVVQACCPFASAPTTPCPPPS